MAKGLMPFVAPPRPHWHPYSTFEYQLPILFCQNSAVRIEPEETVRDAVQKVKPKLKCPFCQGIKIKAFKSVIALWSHFVHQHNKQFKYNAWTQVVILELDLLKEVIRRADLWLTY